MSLGNHSLLRVLFGASLALLALTTPLDLQSAIPEDSYVRATELMRSGNLNAALQEFQKAAQADPDNPKVHNMLGIVLTQLGRLPEANQAYSRALSLAPDFIPARKNRAVNSFSSGDFKFAAQEFEALARLEPKDFVPRLFLGLLGLESADFETARKHLVEARQLAPDNGRVLLALTRAHFGLGEREAALESARKMLSKPRSTDAERFELGVVLAQFEANAEAAEVFQELWAKKPGTYDIGFNLALTRYRSGQLEAALRAVEDLAATTKLSGEALNLRGWTYNKMRRYPQAREALKQAITAEPEIADHHLDLSVVLNNEGDTEAAIQVILGALERSLEKDRMQVQLGLLYQKKKEQEAAERWYRTALQTNPRNRSAFLALANLMLATSREKEALDLLERATKSLSTDPLLHHMYGGLLWELGQEAGPEQFEKALSILKRALELNPLYANTHYLLGKLYVKKGDYGSAQPYLEKACAFNPDHASAYYQLSLIARHQGNKERAKQLAMIVQRLNQKVDKSFQESFGEVVQESLHDSGGNLLPQSKEKPLDSSTDP